MTTQNKYTLQQEGNPECYVITDNENLVSIRFMIHRFNDTQEVTCEEGEQEFLKKHPISEMAKIVGDMADWMMKCHQSIAIEEPAFEIKEVDGKKFVLRNKFPKLNIEIKDLCTEKQLSDALKATGEFIKKRNYGK